jgi:hypothetical protein
MIGGTRHLDHLPPPSRFRCVPTNVQLGTKLPTVGRASAVAKSLRHVRREFNRHFSHDIGPKPGLGHHPAASRHRGRPCGRTDPALRTRCVRWFDNSNAPNPTRPRRTPTAVMVRRLVVELARDKPLWGSRRIHGELAGLRHTLAASTVWKILKDAGLDPAPGWSGPTRRPVPRDPGQGHPGGGLLARGYGAVATVVERLAPRATRVRPCRKP